MNIEVSQTRSVQCVNEQKLQFSEDNGIFYCNNEALDLRDSPISTKLFGLFVQFPEIAIQKEDILSYVYNIDLDKNYSERFRENFDHNVIKLISRSRQMALKAWARTGDHFSWFIFDSVANGWLLAVKKPPRKRLGRPFLEVH